MVLGICLMIISIALPVGIVMFIDYEKTLSRKDRIVNVGRKV
jgi:hypothetical protein